MKTGAELLKNWIGRSTYKQVDAAVALGLTQSYLSLLANGKRVPGRDKAVRIERLTGIPVEAWSSRDVRRSA